MSRSRGPQTPSTAIRGADLPSPLWDGFRLREAVYEIDAGARLTLREWKRRYPLPDDSPTTVMFKWFSDFIEYHLTEPCRQLWRDARERDHPAISGQEIIEIAYTIDPSGRPQEPMNRAERRRRRRKR